MTNTTPPSIGNIITSPGARKAIYGAYGIIALVVACIQVGFASAQIANPTWLTVTLAIVAFLAAPIGALAVANTNNSPVAAVIAVPSADAPVEPVVDNTPDNGVVH